MSLFSKFLAGGLGFALGGPLGALLGVALASMFSTSVRTMPTQGVTTQADFRLSLLVLIAAVMRADNRILKSELDLVKRYLIEIFGEESALEALQLLKQLLREPIELDEIAVQVGQHMNNSSKLQLLHMLYEVAYADGDLAQSEVFVLERISSLMGITSVDANSIKAMFAKQTNREWAYEVLEIAPTATDEEVKRAYRRMAMKFHPDKVAMLGEEIKHSATDKFRKINEAYESIKAQRGM